jgi:phage terminase large subunit-like protein
MRGRTIERLIGEPQKAYEKRCQPEWGLVEWVQYECRRFRVDKLLIEAKASGHTVAQEMARLHRQDEFPLSVELVNPGTQDKRARAVSVQHLFADSMVCAPGFSDGTFRGWAQSLIDVMARFRGLGDEEDNEVDAASQALRYLRDRQWAIREDERAMYEREMRTIKKDQPPLYPG